MACQQVVEVFRDGLAVKLRFVADQIMLMQDSKHFF